MWKKACTVLVHKKGDQSDPANFRPITLECTPLKFFTSCLCDSMFALLSANGYMEHHIQKGFMPKLSGTYEHTAQLAHIIKRARIKQRSVVISHLFHRILKMFLGSPSQSHPSSSKLSSHL